MKRREIFQSLAAAGAACIVRPNLAGTFTGNLSKRARFRSAICAYSFRKALKAGAMTYEDLVRMAVELDIDGLDLTVYWFPSTSDDFLLPLRRLAYRMGVDIYSISVRTEMTQVAAEKRDQEVGKIKKWIDVANRLGATHIRVFGGKVPHGASEDQAAEWVVEVLKPAAEYAGSCGVILGLENHGGITLEAKRIIKIIKKVNSPWVGINLDTGNFPTDPYEQIKLCLPYAVNSQFKTEMRYADGRREPSDWDRILGMFAKFGYKGYLALEYEGEEPESVFARYMAELQRLMCRHSGTQIGI